MAALGFEHALQYPYLLQRLGRLSLLYEHRFIKCVAALLRGAAKAKNGDGDEISTTVIMLAYIRGAFNI